MLFFASLAISATLPFSWPPSYTIIGTWNVPYTNLSNPLIVVHEPNRQYTDQLNGVERIWSTTAEQHFHRKVVGAGDEFICYDYDKVAAEWDIELTEFLPNPTGYRKKNGTYPYNGHLCNLYEKVEAGGKTQTWRLYTDIETNDPVAYVAQAISLYGSHYDVYVLEIQEFIPDALPGVWTLPSLCDHPTRPDPYPGNGFNLFFPGRDDASKKNRQILARSGVNHTRRFTHMSADKWHHSIHRRKGLKSTRGDALDLCEPWAVPANKVELPVNFSWRDVGNVVGPVRDQVACGSCWAFATAEVLESQVAIRTGRNRPVSVNQIMDCTWDNTNEGCQGGEVNFAFASMINSSLKIALNDDYPYIGVSGRCASETDFETIGTVAKCYHIPRKTETVMDALFRLGPLAIGIAVSDSMLLYTNGTFNDTTCTGAADDLVHAVVLTGWKVLDGVFTWEVKNSWSTHWGDEGYVYIQGENQEWNCGVTTDVVAVEVALS
jgi:C1A family cysteine protease